MPPQMCKHTRNLSGPFDYNKMPLTLMGRNTQVHEKTDKQGTCAFHLVDGWYLFTLSEHYCTHNCHVKNTKSKHLSNTVQLQPQLITNPSNYTPWQSGACIGWLCQSYPRHDRQSQTFSDHERPITNSWRNKGTNKGTTQQIWAHSKFYRYPSCAWSSEGANNCEYAHTPHWC